MLVIVAKGFLKLPNLHMLLKQKSPSLPRNLALGTFGELLTVFSTKVNLLCLLYSTDRRCCLLHLIKQSYLLKTFCKNSNLDGSGISLPAFPSRTNLKLHNISVTTKIVKKVITNLDLSKASGPDCIPVVVLKNCVPENYCPASLRSVVSKVIAILVNNSIVDHPEKCGLFSDFEYGFRSSRSTADFLTVLSDRIARAFNRSGATRAVALDISKAFDRVWHAGLLRKLKSYGGQIFGLISSFLSNRRLRWFWMGNLHKNIQLMLEFLKGPFLVLHFSYYTLMAFLMMLLMAYTLMAFLRLLCISINLP